MAHLRRSSAVLCHSRSSADARRLPLTAAVLLLSPRRHCLRWGDRCLAVGVNSAVSCGRGTVVEWSAGGGYQRTKGGSGDDTAR